MKTEVRVTKNFKKEAKPLFKKFPSLVFDLEELEKQLLKEPTLGTALGNNAYKIRLSIKSKGKGKSGGARIISYLQKEIIGLVEKDGAKTVIYLISIYDKADVSSISDKELKDLIRKIDFNI